MRASELAPAQQILANEFERATHTPAPSVTYQLADTQWHLEQAFELVWKSYVRVGLEQENSQGMRLTKYHALPDSKVFVAISKEPGEEDRVIGTITVVPDGALGLPAEEIAAEEIMALRRNGKRAAEFVALASDEEGTRQRVILKLFRLASDFCHQTGYSTILASLTERHIGFYRKFLGFKPLGGLKPYKMGNGTPVQAHSIDMNATSSLLELRAAALERDPNWRSFFENEAAELFVKAERAQPWDADLIRHFMQRSSNFARQLDPRTTKILQAEYQRFGWSFAI